MAGLKDLKVDDKPFDRLTRLCAVLVEALDEAVDAEREADLSAELSDVRGIIFLSDAEHSGIEMFGYEETAEGMTDLLIHMKAIFTSMGKQFGVMTDQGLLLME
jgi:hypothetical protein